MMRTATILAWLAAFVAAADDDPVFGRSATDQPDDRVAAFKLASLHEY